MGAIEVAGLEIRLPSGEGLLHDVSFRVGEKVHAGLVGANGSGKTTLLRVLHGDLSPTAGTFSVAGRLSYMSQMIAPPGDTSGLRDLFCVSNQNGFGEQPTASRNWRGSSLKAGTKRPSTMRMGWRRGPKLADTKPRCSGTNAPSGLSVPISLS